jgi:ectoine hydroxylase-related dioxygenase (phytanoyl-CoA dioxygenase family)
MNVVGRFEDNGFAGTVNVFSAEQSHKLCMRLESCSESPGRFKSNAAYNPLFLELASHPAIVNVLRMLLGDNIMLWGASLVTAQPEHIHPWHSDIETAYALGKTVSVWLALRNVNEKSALHFISGSHRFGANVQYP